MNIQTRSFGKIEIEEDQIISFEEGLPGFEEEKNFVIILNEDEESPFHWLQSTKSPELAFVILNPFEIYDDYDLILPKMAIKKLKIKDQKDIVIYTMVVIPEDIEKMTTNLLGPIVINTKERLGKQVILEEDKYSTKHYVFNQEISSLENDSEGGKKNANTN